MLVGWDLLWGGTCCEVAGMLWGGACCEVACELCCEVGHANCVPSPHNAHFPPPHNAQFPPPHNAQFPPQPVRSDSTPTMSVHIRSNSRCFGAVLSMCRH